VDDDEAERAPWKMSHGFIFQNAARETPRIVKHTSIEMLSAENSPVSRRCGCARA